ncbi:hypothetical protein NBRC116583_28640 [Arenicella sp. 4NH20-0111]|uniref:hypothetical protein n=1 Tax=Arenicella sp. 4NH20-0111 TaxID=3127648 RepID=UPI0031075107
MMVSVTSLWLPILLAGVMCWFASALIHMLIKYHNSDYSELDNEQEVMQALGSRSPKPALYTVPYCADMKDMGSESMQKKFSDGPVAMISILPSGLPAMGKLLSQQVVFFLIGSVMIGVLASMSLVADADYMSVFKLVFLASFLTYGWAQVPYSIWMGQPWSNCVRYLIDALIYAGVTAGVFAWLWP